MENDDQYTLDYAPSAVQHLGVGLYKQLPQALIELITNCWDADATKVNIHVDYTQRTITVADNGNGMTHDELNMDFLRVARNRRTNSRSGLSPNGRKVTGKKGLGKLALFGIANRIQVCSIKDNKKNSFEMNFNVIQNTPDNRKYHPLALHVNEDTSESNGTSITINDLTVHRITPIKNLVNALSKRFDKYSKSNFLVTVTDNKDYIKELDESAFKESIKPSKVEYTYVFPDDFEQDIKRDNALKELKNRDISGEVFTGPTPLPASAQGFSVLSRGKLSSEHSVSQFNERSNDYFYSYATGYFDIDFIDDDLKNDYISTDRQSILWNATDDLMQLRSNLGKLIALIVRRWKADRKAAKTERTKQTLHSLDAVNKVLNSPNLTESDRELLEKTTDILEDDKSSISSHEKKKILELTSKHTDAYKRDNSVYLELIPKNFSVPNTVGSKIRRLREEMVSAATDENNTDKFILSQGLLLRALLDTTTSAVLIKNREELCSLHILNKNEGKNENTIYNIKLGKRYKYLVYYLAAKGKLSNSNSKNVIVGDFNRLNVTSHLDQLMHDDERWPTFKTLKEIWDSLCPNLLKAFELL
ncbi:ATP-binding protein [Lactiplantibacillus plantarum]|uniref:ATP-binding protein n=1 Tax=Lactiplantibacillus plantarum TaxID=1590 RepID=UPI000DD46C71|nr:ATP-binding protein [Lactiplantibacillus plantarum]MCJ1648937.1 ATP-binding protein [Lactiplantibacillus plantarum subsp. plantarum]MCT3206269.1 ATP-binding protein [Lactiplantibacillus plantarum]MCT3219813.1 ATP-binding protein [Lactiplantibacillus plantarum]MCT3281861.1 ATP-binding protein [Lactiplantibacillus plantarum]MDI5784517.1 ATP-binding protein [Lactiplantibacillus plantarum]